MIPEAWMLLAGAAGMALVVVGGATLLAARHRENREGILPGERRTLAEVSGIWTGRGKVVHFRDIARLWRHVPQVEEGTKRVRPVFRHPEIEAFFAEWVERRSAVKGVKRTLIEKILSTLDREGDCPSVVRKTQHETEAKLDKDVFARLAMIPLWRHTLSVAEAIARRTRQEVMLPDALIAALAHDLGKIPAHLDALYRTGDHPLISLILLHRIPEFETMPNREEVGEAIRQHHMVKPDSPLATALKEADRQVRLEEISLLTRPDVSQPSGGSAEEATDVPATEASAAVSRPDEIEDRGAPEKEENPGNKADGEVGTDSPVSGEQPLPAPTGEPQEPSPDGHAVPRWLNPEAILAGLQARINVLTGGRWSVVSSPEGLVFAQPDALWEVVKKVAGGDPEVLAADGDEATKRKILLLVVRELGRQKKGVATEFVADGYYTSQCIVVMVSGRTLQVPLVPFRVEAFGLLPSDLEALKVDRLKKMVRTVKPKQVHGGGEQCGVFG